MLRKSNKSIKKVTIHFLKPMVLSNLKLHFTTTRSSTFSGFNLALLGVTTLPATEKTRSDLDEAAGTRKTTLTSLAQKGELRLVMICGRHLWLGCTCTEVTLQWRHQDCLQSISNFGCRFLRNNTVLLDGRHGC